MQAATQTFADRPRLRPARALLGWMTQEEALLMQAGRREEDTDKPEYELRARQTRLVAASRRPSIDVRGVVTEPPATLRKWIAAFEANPRAAPLLAEGWRIALVDLTRVCAGQPAVFTDTQIPDVDPDDLAAIADFTLQMPTAMKVDAQYDKDRHAWILPAPSPNFRIVTEFTTELEPDVRGFGFAVRLLGSFLQAARYRDRFLLRDGYHRSVALLQRGINIVPGLVREYGTEEDVRLRRGHLPPDTYLGSRPPLLPDYLDDDVSAEVLLPAVRRAIVIQGMDFPVYG